MLFEPDTIPGIDESYGADYLRLDGRRLGAVFAGTTASNHDADVVIARFSEGEIASRSTRIMSGSSFDVISITRDSGETVYAISFSATSNGQDVVVDGDTPYESGPSDNDLQVVAWADSEEAAALLIAATLDILAESQTVGFASETPQETLVVRPRAFPNPFVGRTSVEINLPLAAQVELALYDILGRRISTIASGEFQSGLADFSVDARKLPAGIYIVRLIVDGRVSTQRITSLG